MSGEKISLVSKILVAVSGIALVVSIFVPIWRIELSAPQYPEGLVMLIYANKLGGDVEIINGLNHYIGMQTLHAENFIEFTILQYLIGFFALACLLVVAVGKKKGLYVLFFSFVLFGVVAMVDFWRWEYNYGHDLDPNAAIIVPGMAYQPPLIGYKVLLNFGAYSIPDLGGWLFVAAGIMMLAGILFETGVLARFLKKKQMASVLIGCSLLVSCGPTDPEPIRLNADACDFCKMTIADGRFGAELITAKGRVYKFDDLDCMLGFEKENQNLSGKTHFVHNYQLNNQLIKAETAFFLSSENLKSPMNGNKAAFASQKEAAELLQKMGGEVLDWKAVAK